MALTQEMIEKLRRIAAESTNEKARTGAREKLEAEGISLTESKGSQPKAERKKREPKAKGEPKPKYKVGDVLNHEDSGETYKVKITAVTGWTGDGHRYDIEFLDENLKPLNKFAKSYDDKLSRISKSKADQPYDCDDLIAKAEERKAKAKKAAEKRANEPKKTQATKNVEAVDRTAERIEKNVEKRVKKGDVSVAEIDKIIAEYETALTKLRALREKASSKMAKGGGVNAEEVEHILMKAQGVKEHHCGCGDKKMAKGGRLFSKEDITILGVPRSKITEFDWKSILEMAKHQDGATLILKNEKGQDVKPQVEFEWYVNEKMATGGSIYADLSEKEFANKIFGANVFTENISEYFDVKKLSSSNDNKVEKFISDLKADGYYVKKKAYSDFTSVIGVKKKALMAKGGGVGRGINKKYAYFAVDKKDMKIVNAWELTSDVESLKYYAKQDLIDDDRNPKEFSILSKNYLISQSIDPFDKSNWKN